MQGSEIQFGRFYMLAHSEEMKRVLAFALRSARSEASTILLEGESGTGKDVPHSSCTIPAIAARDRLYP